MARGRAQLTAIAGATGKRARPMEPPSNRLSTRNTGKPACGLTSSRIKIYPLYKTTGKYGNKTGYVKQGNALIFLFPLRDVEKFSPFFKKPARPAGKIVENSVENVKYSPDCFCGAQYYVYFCNSLRR